MKIRFYGKLADLFGAEIAIDSAARSIGELRNQLMQQDPRAAAMLADRRARACVRDCLVPDSHCIEVGEDIEFFAPVSGG